MERDTRRLALISVALGIAIVTLLPARAGLIHGFHPGMHASPWKNLLVTDIFDVVQNILLYMPLGYLAAAAVTAREGGVEVAARGRFLRAGLLGLGLSALLEGLQIWIPGRFCSVFDLMTNGAGALLGGLAALAAPIVLDPIFSDPGLPER